MASTCAISLITFSRVATSRILGRTNCERKMGKWLPCLPTHSLAIWRMLRPLVDDGLLRPPPLSVEMPSDLRPRDSSSLSMRASSA